MVNSTQYHIPEGVDERTICERLKQSWRVPFAITGMIVACHIWINIALNLDSDRQKWLSWGITIPAGEIDEIAIKLTQILRDKNSD